MAQYNTRKDLITMTFFTDAWQHKLSILLMALFSLLLCSSSSAFVARTGTTKLVSKQGKSFRSPLTQLDASGSTEIFKGGLLADDYSQELAVELASKKLRKISDLGWKNKEARRQSNIRPKLWPFGGSDELAIQDKANYSLDNPNCPDPWLGLEDFYSLVNDDTAAADLIFVALAGGRAYVERKDAEDVLASWWGTNGVAGGKSKAFQKQQFDRVAFEKTVKTGQRDFIVAWGSFLFLTGFAAAGIVFPTNPLQLALVDLVDSIL